MNYHNMEKTLNTTTLQERIGFRTTCYRKNYDIVNVNDSIITEYDGVIDELRYDQNKIPLIIGEYSYSVWNIKLGKFLGIDINQLIQSNASEASYEELINQINEGNIDITKYRRMLIIHTLIIREKYCKQNITEEFIEAIYRDFYDEETIILTIAKPYQEIPNDKDYYENVKTVEIFEANPKKHPLLVSAFEFYSLYRFETKDDKEYNCYKLFSVASKCGFTRIGESYLFKFIPLEIVKRIKKRNKIT